MECLLTPHSFYDFNLICGETRHTSLSVSLINFSMEKKIQIISDMKGVFSIYSKSVESKIFLHH